MAPENASVFVAEPDFLWRGNYRRWLERAGHTVVATADSLEDAEVVIPTLEDLGVQVAIVSDTLGNGHGVSDGTEAALVVSELRAINPDISIIGSTYSGRIEGTDADVLKLYVKPDELNDIITGL